MTPHFLAPALANGLALADGSPLGRLLPIASVAPFAVLLLAIALLPLVAGHWWEHNKNRALVSFTLGAGFVAWLLWAHGHAAHHALHESALDYVSFIALLGSLYVVSGGIYIKGSLAGSPLSNTALFSIGAVLANLIGTTGASMVLIRPLLRANATRVKKQHIVVFFIFIVSNCGGLLTPLGDPPLFLGFLKGVPFEWTLTLWKEWALVNGLLVVLFFFVDTLIFDAEEKARPGSQLEEALKHEPLRLEGGLNVLFLVGIVLAILGKGQGWGTDGRAWAFGWQEGLLIALGVVAYATTRPATRAANRFTFGPIFEVAILFAGIFATMIAPLTILNARGSELGIEHPAQYFWATGLLSSVLDNAPTYLTMAATATGQFGVTATDGRHLAVFLTRGPEAVAILAAISCGAVMMGALTYIGNGPNFMVKAIAEDSGVKMPSFFGYMGWSAVILLPTFLLVSYVFFRAS